MEKQIRDNPFETIERARLIAEVRQHAEKHSRYSGYSRALARNAEACRDWKDGGYDAAFEEAWNMGLRDVEAITEFVLIIGGTKSRAALMLKRFLG